MPQPYDEEEKRRITWQIYALYARYGFDGISMQEVADNVHVSKATLYKYLGSKREIVQGMVDMASRHLESIHMDLTEGIAGVLAASSEIFIKSVLVTGFSSSPFLADMRHRFPDLNDQVRHSITLFRDRFTVFYENGVKAGYLRNLSVRLLIRQFYGTLINILDAKYREALGLSLEDALREYYRLFLCQIISGEYESVIGESDTYLFVEGLAKGLERAWSIIQEDAADSKRSHHTGRFHRWEEKGIREPDGEAGNMFCPDPYAALISGNDQAPPGMKRSEET